MPLIGLLYRYDEVAFDTPTAAAASMHRAFAN
jgi:hypothetical protein